jgi:hypothetical protein
MMKKLNDKLVDTYVRLFEMGKELSKMYAKYDGDKDWAEWLKETIPKISIDGEPDILTELKNELLFDLDEIENKPWRVFRQLANLMPEYADTYTRYEAFYSFGGGRKVMALIEEFEKTDDYKESYFFKKEK